MPSDYRIWRMEDSYPVYYMNPSVITDSWTNYFANTMCLDFIQNTPSVDGIFLDDAYYWLDRDSISPPLMHSTYGDTVLGRSLTFSQDWDQNLLNNWNTLILAHVQNVQTALNSAPGQNMVIPNPWKHMHFCEQITHVYHWEGFIHAR